MKKIKNIWFKILLISIILMLIGLFIGCNTFGTIISISGSIIYLICFAHFAGDIFKN